MIFTFYNEVFTFCTKFYSICDTFYLPTTQFLSSTTILTTKRPIAVLLRGGDILIKGFSLYFMSYVLSACRCIFYHFTDYSWLVMSSLTAREGHRSQMMKQFTSANSWMTLIPVLLQTRTVLWRTFCTKINCVVVREWYLPDLSTDQDFRKIHHVKLHKYEYLYTI